MERSKQGQEPELKTAARAVQVTTKRMQSKKKKTSEWSWTLQTPLRRLILIPHADGVKPQCFSIERHLTAAN